MNNDLLGIIDDQGRVNKEVVVKEYCPTLRAEAHGNDPKVVIPVITPDREKKRQNGRRFKENGDPSFTLTAQDRHGIAIGYPLGVLRNVRSDFGKQIRKQYESGSVAISRHEFLEKEIRDDNISNTLDTVQKDNWLAIGIDDTYGYDGVRIYDNGYMPTLRSERFGLKVGLGIEGERMNKEDNGKYPGIYVQLSDDCTVYAIWYPKYECYIAIRKLTPKECFRLQGWDDEYFEKAQLVNSDSQLYKQAGNGVTVNVVYEIAKRIPV